MIKDAMLPGDLIVNSGLFTHNLIYNDASFGSGSCGSLDKDDVALLISIANAVDNVATVGDSRWLLLLNGRMELGWINITFCMNVRQLSPHACARGTP